MESTKLPGNGSFYDPFKRQQKKPFNPIIIDSEVDPEVAKLQRGTEDKMYIVLYYNLEYEEYKFKKFYGRYDTYFGIKDILDAESVDLRLSEVLVETVGINPTSKKPLRYITHPENASNIIDFCHLMEKFFGENSYSIEEYDTGVTHEESAENTQLTESAIPRVPDPSVPRPMKNFIKDTINLEQALVQSMGLESPADLPYGNIADCFKSSGIDVNSLYMSSEEASEVSKKVFIPSTLEGVEEKEI